MHDRDAAAATLWLLKGLGVRIAIDDFGTGYSSLAYLRRFPIDMLKVAREFVDGLGRDAHDDVITRAIVELAAHPRPAHRRRGHRDHPAVGAPSAALGCDIAQGYLFSRPIEAEAAQRRHVRVVVAEPREPIGPEPRRCRVVWRPRADLGSAAGTSPAASISRACSRHHGDQRVALGLLALAERRPVQQLPLPHLGGVGCGVPVNRPR